MSFDAAYERLIAAETHFDETEKLYDEDTKAYGDSRKQLAEATVAYYEERSSYSKKYAKLEYNVEKAKIQAIIALNKATYASDSKVQQERIDSAKQILKASYDSGIDAIREHFRKKRALEEKDAKDALALLTAAQKKEEAVYEKLKNLETGDAKGIKAKSDSELRLLKIKTDIDLIITELPAKLAKVDAAVLKAIDTSEKKSDALTRQFEALKKTSEISLNSDDPRDLEKAHKIQMDTLLKENKFRLDSIKEVAEHNLLEKGKIALTEKINDALIIILKKKHAKEIHERILENQAIEFDGHCLPIFLYP